MITKTTNDAMSTSTNKAIGDPITTNLVDLKSPLGESGSITINTQESLNINNLGKINTLIANDEQFTRDMQLNNIKVDTLRNDTDSNTIAISSIESEIVSIKKDVSFMLERVWPLGETRFYMRRMSDDEKSIWASRGIILEFYTPLTPGTTTADVAVAFAHNEQDIFDSVTATYGSLMAHTHDAIYHGLVGNTREVGEDAFSDNDVVKPDKFVTPNYPSGNKNEYVVISSAGNGGAYNVASSVKLFAYRRIN